MDIEFNIHTKHIDQQSYFNDNYRSLCIIILTSPTKPIYIYRERERDFRYGFSNLKVMTKKEKRNDDMYVFVFEKEKGKIE